MDSTCPRVLAQGELLWLSVLLLGSLTWLFLLRHLRRDRHRHRHRPLPLPPGPPSLPLVGCLPFLPNIQPPELLFEHLANKYGDLMLLRLGARTIVVVSSARMAMEFLKHHDAEFANRSSHIAYQHLSWNDTALVPMSSVNPLFKRTRRMFAMEVVAPRKVVEGEEVRKVQVVKMIRAMVEEMEDGRGVNVTKAVSALALKLALCIALGQDFADEAAGEVDTMVCIFQKLMHLLIRSSYGNYGDFIPALRWLDLQGLERQFHEVKAQLRSSITALIDKKKQEMSAWSEEEVRGGATERDVVSKLLSMEGEERFSEEQIVSVVFTLLQAGTASISQTIIEAIHEVVSHPPIHKRAVQALDAITHTTRLVSPSDLPDLPDLHNIIKETLRCHPPAPTFPPHRSFRPCEVGGYTIPADASVVITLPPIMRDASFWEAPGEFRPERFEKVKATPQGSEEHFIPFGFGKRQCPAVGLSMATVTYAVAVLLQCVEWRLAEEVDRRANVGTAAEPRKKLDLVLQGKLRVDPGLLDAPGDAELIRTV